MATQETLRAYKFALDPTPRQAEQMARSAGSARVAYNWGLNLTLTARKAWRARLEELTEQGHSESEAKKILKKETADFRKRVKTLDTQKKDLKKAAREEKNPAAKAHLQQQAEQAKKDHEALQYEGIQSGLTLPTAFDMSTQWRTIRDLPKEQGGTPWWDEVSSYVWSTGFANAARAWKNFTDSYSGKRAGQRVGYPSFKKKGKSRDSFTIFHDVKNPTIRAESSACNWHHRSKKKKKSQVNSGRHRGLMVPSIGTIRTHDSTSRLANVVRQGRATVQSVTISRSGEHWYASVLARVQQDHPDKPTRRQVENGTVAVKWSTTEITLHHGEERFEAVPQPRYLRQNAHKLAAAQRCLSRTDKKSGRRDKARRRVAELHHRVAIQREGWLHQLTARLTKQHEAVALEDLNVQAMVKAEQPRAKTRRRNKAILDTAPGEMGRQIQYKTSWYGSTVALTDKELAPTQTCSECGRRNPSPTPPGVRFHCAHCNLAMDRNRNAAKVISRNATVPATERDAAQDDGEAQNARGAPVRPPSGEARGRESGRPAGHSP